MKYRKKIHVTLFAGILFLLLLSTCRPDAPSFDTANYQRSLQRSDALDSLGSLDYGRGHFEKAIAHFDSALQIRNHLLATEKIVGSEALLIDIVRCYRIIGACWHQLNYYDRAKAYADSCLIAQRKFKEEYGMASPYRRAKLFHLYGQIFTEVGEIEKAHQNFWQAIHTYEACKMTDPGNKKYLTFQSKVFLDLSHLYASWENADSTIAYAGKGMQLLKDSFPAATYLQSIDYASLCLNAGVGYELKDDYARAQSYYDQAYRIVQARDLEWAQLMIANNRSIISRKLGRYSQAERELINTMARNRALGNRHLLAANYANLGITYQEAGHLDKALDAFREAFLLLLENRGEGPVLDSRGNPLIDRQEVFIYNKIDLLHTLSGKAATHLSLGQPEEALATYQVASRLIERSKLDYQDATSKVQFAALAKRVFEAAIAACLSLPEPDVPQAFEFSEQSKVFTLLENVKHYRALRTASIRDPRILQREIDIRNAIQQSERAYQAAVGSDQKQAMFLRWLSLKEQRRELLREFEIQYPDYFRLKYDFSVPAISHIQKGLLDPDQTLVEFFVGEKATYAFVLPAQGKLSVRMLPVNREWLSRWGQAMRTSISHKFAPVRSSIQMPGPKFAGEKNDHSWEQVFGESAHLLYRHLIEPIEPSLHNRRILIVPDAALGYLPFDALLRSFDEGFLGDYSKYQFLGGTYPLSYCYSASLLQEMRRREEENGSGRMLAIALDEFSSHVHSLSDILQKDHWWEKQRVYPLVGEQASKQNFRNMAGRFAFIHLSVHGWIDDREPGRSHLLLDDGPLYLHEIYNIPLQAQMIVTGACDAGVGRLFRGEGIMSLARGFSHAGAKSVITTLWRVNPQATEELLSYFYQQLKEGFRKDEALYRAKKQFLSNRPASQLHPYFWAGFIPVGDMRAVHFRS